MPFPLLRVHLCNKTACAVKEELYEGYGERGNRGNEE